MVKVEFHFDFASPNAYLCHLVIPQIEKRTGVTFDYIPVLLGGIFKLTNNSPPFVANEGVRNKSEYARLETERFVRRHGITRYTMNPHFPVNTLHIMRGAIVAQSDGVFARYADAVFRHMWAEPKKMDEPEVIRAVLDGAGLDGAGILERCQAPEVKQQLADNTEASVDRGVFGAPSFFVGEELFFGKDRLPEIEEEIRRAAGNG